MKQILEQRKNKAVDIYAHGCAPVWQLPNVSIDSILSYWKLRDEVSFFSVRGAFCTVSICIKPSAANLKS